MDDKFRVLLIDDERNFLETLSKRLSKRNLVIRSAYSGEEALETLGEFPADVVVLDVKMPGMGGIETLREIKRAHPLTEVVILTGHADLQVAMDGMQLGAFDYLLKPIDIDELVYKLQDAYNMKALEEKKTGNVQDLQTG